MPPGDEHIEQYFVNPNTAPWPVSRKRIKEPGMKKC